MQILSCQEISRKSTNGKVSLPSLANYPPTETVNRESQEVRRFYKRGPDCRRYNEPTHDEVAVVFVGEDGAPPVNRDIVIYLRNRLPQRISYMSCHLDPMCYPILFPRGDPGWHNCMTHVAEHQTSTRKNVTMQQFYGYRLAVRSQFSPIHSSGKLFQQYAVDAYVKTEGCRLYYVRNNQTQLRVDLYSGKHNDIVQCTYII